MDVVLTVADCLNRIFELREVIRHQRHVNKKTYLRLVEIDAEIQVLQRDGTIQDNTMPRCAAIFERFHATVLKFERYLHKYCDQYRAVRIFKLSQMEEQRLEIVDEVDHLFRMLGLATSATVMKGAYKADKNAAEFLTKLKKIHKDVKLTHDQVQAALLKLVEQRAAQRKSMREPKVIREMTTAPQEPMAEPKPEKGETKVLKSPKPRVLESNEDNVSAKPTSVTTLPDPAPVSIAAAVTEAVDEKEKILDPLEPELCEASTEEVYQAPVESAVGEEDDTKAPDSAPLENINVRISANNSPTKSTYITGSEFKMKVPTDQATVMKVLVPSEPELPADKNAAKFLTKLKKIHKDVKLTHDQVQAALLKLVEKRAAQQKSMREPKVIREMIKAPQEPIAEPEPEKGKTKVLKSSKPRVLESNEDNVSAKLTSVTTLPDPAPVSIAATVTEAVDEKEKILDPLEPELCEASTEEVYQAPVESAVGVEDDTKAPDSAALENINVRISANNSPTKSTYITGSEFKEKVPTEPATVMKVLVPSEPELCQSSTTEVYQDTVPRAIGDEAETQVPVLPDSTRSESTTFCFSANNSPTKSMLITNSKFEEKLPTERTNSRYDEDRRRCYKRR